MLIKNDYTQVSVVNRPDYGLEICCQNFLEKLRKLTSEDVEFVANKLHKRNIFVTRQNILKGGDE